MSFYQHGLSLTEFLSSNQGRETKSYWRDQKIWTWIGIPGVPHSSNLNHGSRKWSAITSATTMWRIKPQLQFKTLIRTIKWRLDDSYYISTNLTSNAHLKCEPSDLHLNYNLDSWMHECENTGNQPVSIWTRFSTLTNAIHTFFFGNHGIGMKLSMPKVKTNFRLKPWAHTSEYILIITIYFIPKG